MLAMLLLLQVVEFACQLHLAEFKAGDAARGSQLVLLTGPSHQLFATDDELSELQVTAALCGGGQEAAQLLQPSGYHGTDTIAYRSTKVGATCTSSAARCKQMRGHTQAAHTHLRGRHAPAAAAAVSYHTSWCM
jgi:hypothetical protein